VEGAAVSTFGYMSVHFIATMKKEHSGPRYDHIASFPFEIQVRTIAMDAWANVSRYLDYRTDQDVPNDLKRDFYALSGLFYVADKHFEMFYKARTQSQEHMIELFEEASSQTKAEQEINLDSLSAFLRKRVPTRSPSGSKEISELVDDLVNGGYRSMGQVEELVENASSALTAWNGQAGLSDVGAVRISGRISDRKFNKIVVHRAVPEAKREDIFASSEQELRI
jgi:hypothetical protein